MENKAILMSIQPNWVAKILNGEKTIEVRKKFPKDYVGWVYIYCTKKDDLCSMQKLCHNDRFICGKDFDNRDFPHLHSGYNGKGKVVARFWCDKVSVIERYCGTFIPISGYTTFLDKRYSYQGLKEATCLNDEELFRYLGYKNGYAIHIIDLKPFDKPKEMKEFRHFNKPNCDSCPFQYSIDFECEYHKEVDCDDIPLTKAPQNFCYVEDTL